MSSTKCTSNYVDSSKESNPNDQTLNFLKEKWLSERYSSALNNEFSDALEDITCDTLDEPRNKKGETILMMACKLLSQRGQDIADNLVSLGANPDIQDTDGRTALMHAVGRNAYSRSSVLILANANADLYIQDNNGYTALMLAVQNGKQQIIRTYLMSSDLSLQNEDGKSAITEALEVWSGNPSFKSVQIMKLLLKMDPPKTGVDDVQDQMYSLLKIVAFKLKSIKKKKKATPPTASSVTTRKSKKSKKKRRISPTFPGIHDGANSDVDDEKTDLGAASDVLQGADVDDDGAVSDVEDANIDLGADSDVQIHDGAGSDEGGGDDEGGGCDEDGVVDDGGVDDDGAGSELEDDELNLDDDELNLSLSSILSLDSFVQVSDEDMSN